MGEGKPIMCDISVAFLPHAASDAHTQIDISVCVEQLVEINYEIIYACTGFLFF